MTSHQSNRILKPLLVTGVSMCRAFVFSQAMAALLGGDRLHEGENPRCFDDQQRKRSHGSGYSISVMVDTPVPVACIRASVLTPIF
jgi:hypothetical protein